MVALRTKGLGIPRFYLQGSACIPVRGALSLACYVIAGASLMVSDAQARKMGEAVPESYICVLV